MIEHYLAKSTGMTLVEHTNDVVEAAQNLIPKLPFNEEEYIFWLDKIVRCAKLHDIGKIHAWFQENLKAAQSVNSIRHEIMSLWLIEQFLELPQDECFAIATHHKGVVPDLTDLPYGRLDLDILINNMPELTKEFYDFDKLKQFMEDWILAFDLNLKSKKPSSCHYELSQDIVKLLRKKFHPKIEKILNNDFI
jgi:CRISPR-associated endonuclease/helicase Cas3